MSRFDRVIDADVLDRREPVPPPLIPRVRPRPGQPLLFDEPVGSGGGPPELWFSPVTVVDPGSGERVKFKRGTVVMPIPPLMGSEDAIVTGDEVRYRDAFDKERADLLPTMALKDFKVGDRCLMPSRITVYGLGRTCWVPVEIVAT